MKFIVRANELIKKIFSLSKNEIYTLCYNRVNPKCENCGVSNSRWRGETHCPNCGAELSYNKVANCVLTHDTVVDGGLFKYYDVKGGNRCCRISNITRAIIGDDEYFVVKL